jgi:hypothetical protein
LLEAGVNAFSERHLPELVEDNLIHPFAGAVGLWVTGLGSRVLDVVQIAKQLVGVLILDAAVLCPAVGERAQQTDPVAVEKW